MTELMGEALELLLTERVDDRYRAIDTASVAELARLMNEADAEVPKAVAALDSAGLDVKVAVMMIGNGSTVDDATQLMAVHAGRLREALEASP
jgi:N-acetylmuramic acid 6-phosphate (MurNAc-6-P) etherase